MDITKMFKKRWGNAEGYEDGVIYTEVLDGVAYKTHQNGVIRYKQRLEKNAVISETETRNNLEWLVPKIPFKYYLMTLDFYKDVNEKYRTEACVLFYWNKNNIEIPADLLEQYGSGIIQDGQLIVIAPKQKNSGALSQFVETIQIGPVTKTIITPMIKWLEDNTVCIMETHSHNSMSAFWSPTDDANERHSRLRLYTVIGHVDAEEMVKCRVHALGSYFDLNIEDIFIMPTIKADISVEGLDFDAEDLIPSNLSEKVYTGPFPYKETHPESWFDLFTVSGGTKSKFSNKYNRPNNSGKTHLEYLYEDDDEEENLIEEFDAEYLEDLEPNYLNNSIHNKKAPKRMNEMTTEEYNNFIKDLD